MAPTTETVDATAANGGDAASTGEPSVAPPRGKRTFLTNAQKLQLRAFWAANPQLHLQDVVEWVQQRFGVPIGRATLYRISHAPAAAFEGNARQKKGRRVKFPAFERDVLAFCDACRQQRRNLPDDELLRRAVELRARHNIPHESLKLSNGWLHSFKERHSLRAAVHARGSSTPPSVSPDALPQEPQVGQVVAVSVSTPSPLPQLPSRDVGAVTPLTYLSAKALSSVHAVSFLNWERLSGMHDAAVFSIVDDGVCVRKAGTYQINVDLEHSEPLPSPGVVFKVWHHAALLGECSSCLRQESGLALSVFHRQAALPADAVLRVEFLAPGVALHSSRLVVKLVTLPNISTASTT